MKNKNEKILRKLWVALVAPLLLLSVTTNSQAEDDAVRFSNTAYKQVITKGKDGKASYDYVEPNLVLPKDVILYEVTFENISKQDVSNIVINNPIANNSIYRDGSVSTDSTDVTFSVDGKNFSDIDSLTVKSRDGKTTKATAENYTAIRWVYKKTLKPGEKGKVSYKTTIK